MEGKLIKQEDGYYALYNAEGIFISDVNGGSLANRLSLKNCQAIENGYDLDELAGEYANKELNVELTSKAGNFYGFSSSFKEGFQKALEILGDKKFSEEDVKKTLYLKNGFDKDGFSFYKSDEEIIQSLQQTEWNVEIEQELIQSSIEGEAIWKLKLDTDGCLILKRK